MKKYVIGNWKMNPQSLAQAKRLLSSIEKGLAKLRISNALEVVISAPVIYLPELSKIARQVKLGVQDLAHQDQDPLTGGVSAKQLKQFGISYAIIGHSERRKIGDTDQLINQKLHQAIAHKIIPVLCVGYGVRKGDGARQIKKIIAKQVKLGFSGINIKKQKAVIAFEQVWSISHGLGTGKADQPVHAKEFIEYLMRLVPKTVAVIYGGSADGNNAPGFAAAGICGVLPGGASLHAKEFLKIVKAFN